MNAITGEQCVVTTAPITHCHQQRREILLASEAAHHIKGVVPIKTYGDGTTHWNESRVYIVMEHCRGGDLLAALKEETIYTPAEKSTVALELTEALHLLHAKDILHRDIKPENIFIQNGPDGPHIRIGDFGLSCRATDTPAIRQDCVVGTPCYFSPALAKASQDKLDEDFAKLGTPACDVFAMGAVLFEVFTRETFTDKLNPGKGRLLSKLKDLTSSQVEGIVNSPSIPKVFQPVIRGMLAVDPNLRLTAEQAHSQMVAACAAYGIQQRSLSVRIKRVFQSVFIG